LNHPADAGARYRLASVPEYPIADIGKYQRLRGAAGVAAASLDGFIGSDTG
jgi:hypothetical protein